MDCVNHSGVRAAALLPELRQGTVRGCVRTGLEGRFSASRARRRGRRFQQPFVAAHSEASRTRQQRRFWG